MFLEGSYVQERSKTTTRNIIFRNAQVSQAGNWWEIASAIESVCLGD